MSVVVGYIESPEGRAALQRAVAEARLRDLPLTVVHSLRNDARIREAEDVLARIDEELNREGIRYEVRELVRGKPAGEDLVAFAHEHGADLIVIGLRRRSPVGKLVLGSNAQDVLLGADCPVLTVKAAGDGERSPT